MRIGVIGAGYVGLSIACLLSQDNDVVVVDISEDRVQKINRREAPFKDSTISAFFGEKQLNLSATTDYQKVKKSDFIIISVPTNYDEETSKLDTSIVESSIEKALHYSPESTIVVKSTVGIGFTEKMASLYPKNTILFSPEFLREGKALYDNLYPSRIVVGGLDKKAAKDFGNLLKEHALNNPKVIISSSGSAEAIKLFSNTYLALRVAFFNELDTFAMGKHLSAREIIRGISADPRIGDYYNNPSFGFGGYCLPKDTKQILANYRNIPQDIIRAISDSNVTRKQFIADQVIASGKNPVGIYLLSMKAGSDNTRESAILDIISLIKEERDVIIYDPSIKEKSFRGCSIVNDFKKFVDKSEIILANRLDDKSIIPKDKLFTRDITGGDE